MKIHFYLRPPDKEGGKYYNSNSMIVLQLKHKGMTRRWSTGYSINKDLWNYKDEEIKNVAATRKSREVNFNKILEEYKGVALDYFTLNTSPFPTQEDFIKHMKAYAKSKDPDHAPAPVAPIEEPAPPSDNKPTFHSMLESLVEKKRRKGVPGTISNYEGVQKHFLKLYPDLKFEQITEDWWDKFTEQLRSGAASPKGMTCGGRTISNDLGILTNIMDTAVQLGLPGVNKEYEDFEVDEEEPDGVALMPEEIQALFKLKFDETDPTQKRYSEARDLLIFACHTGLRWSDFSNIPPERIIKNGDGYKIIIRALKNGAKISVNAHPAILKIFKRYPDSPNMLPQGHKKRQFNDDVKELCKNAPGFDIIGTLQSEPAKQLWQNVSSRIGRRSFATNLYQKRDNPDTPISLMEIMQKTGHKTEDAFTKYIKPRQTSADLALDRIHAMDLDNY